MVIFILVKLDIPISITLFCEKKKNKEDFRASNNNNNKQPSQSHQDSCFNPISLQIHHLHRSHLQFSR
ncbi:hypothetical protein L6452_33792 [Arctium lappa]|uniref:Uncharacterized protein n=1 Tax=Arctium lappa TaxID=4217 RepID=A0ACB8YGK2_ARCLA|nr:hypothetical protein L6452_33792 [Arctium lappa]